MTLTQTIAANTPTKSGGCTVTVRVEVSGPTDGTIAVLRDVVEAVQHLPRLAGAVVTPPEEKCDCDEYEPPPPHYEVRKLPVRSVRTVERPPLMIEDDSDGPAADLARAADDGNPTA